jgi:hypothetical protein
VLDLLGRHVGELLAVLIGGIGNEDVEATELVDGALDELGAELCVGEIAGDQDAAPPLGLDSALRLVGIALLDLEVIDRDVRTLARTAPRRRDRSRSRRR